MYNIHQASAKQNGTNLIHEASPKQNQEFLHIFVVLLQFKNIMHSQLYLIKII